MLFNTFPLDQQTHNIVMNIQQPTQIASCCNLLAPVRHLSSNKEETFETYNCVENNTAFIRNDT